MKVQQMITDASGAPFMTLVTLHEGSPVLITDMARGWNKVSATFVRESRNGAWVKIGASVVRVCKAAIA